MGTFSGEKNSRFGHSVTSCNLYPGIVSVSEDTLRSEKCTPTHIQQTPVNISNQHSQKRRKDSENVNITRKRNGQAKKKRIQLKIPKNSCSKFPLEEGSK